jgi:cytosine/uracil/thiamine/allantoin permease
MSVSTMARLAEGDSAEPDSTLQSALRLVAAYVPSEAIAIYIVILGLLNPGQAASDQDVSIVRLICFLLGIGVALALPFATFKGGALTRREQRRRQAVVAVMAAVAFAIYAAAMPSFFIEAELLTIDLSHWAAVLAVIVTLLLPVVARSLNVRR